MKNMIETQRGITFLGLVFVLAFIAIMVLFTLRAFPLYYERTQMASAMDSVAHQENSAKFSDKEAQIAFLKAIQITNISRFNDRNIKDFLTVEKGEERNAGKVLHLKYQATNTLAGELQLLLTVEISKPLSGIGTGG